MPSGLEASVAGSKLTNLLPSHSKSWWPIVEDVFSSRVCKKLSEHLLLECTSHSEFAYLSVDGTVKCTMPLLGQVRPGGKRRRVKEPLFLSPEEAIDTVVTVRGRSGAVVGFWPLLSEKAEHLQEAFKRNLPQTALEQVECLATEAPSSHLFSVLQEIMPCLQALCLDPVHLAIKYEYGAGRHRTKGSSALRALLSKFNATDARLDTWQWGPFFTGQHARLLSAREKCLRDQILTFSMAKSKAECVLGCAENNSVWADRAQFIEALAAISAVFWEEVQRKSEKKSKRICEHLAYAAEPERLEWLFNNLRFRAGKACSLLSLLSSGTTSNEALHAEMRAWFRQIQSMHQSSLHLKCCVFRLRKLLEHNTAMCRPTTRQLAPGHVLARRLGQKLWTSSAWQQFTKEAQGELSLKRLRDQHANSRRRLVLRQANLVRRKLVGKQKPPAIYKTKYNHQKKRTAFTLPRASGMIRAGVSKRLRAVIAS